MTGGDTAVDQRVIARVEEPLLHLVRNAVTHGLESPEERERAGKRRAGTIRIEARQEGERVRVIVADDGRGFDIAALLESAIAAGHLTRDAAATLAREQAIDLAFVAGVSTAAGTDHMAGRGMGLDVVRSTVESTGGSIHLMTEAVSRYYLDALPPGHAVAAPSHDRRSEWRQFRHPDLVDHRRTAPSGEGKSRR